MKRIPLIIALFFLFLACSCGDECIKCQDIAGYPNTSICKDTYETTLTGQATGWNDYRDEALQKGCTKQ